jgi:hypothetical protein
MPQLKMSYVRQSVTFGGKIAGKDVMTIWIINILFSVFRKILDSHPFHS